MKRPNLGCPQAHFTRLRCQHYGATGLHRWAIRATHVEAIVVEVVPQAPSLLEVIVDLEHLRQQRIVLFVDSLVEIHQLIALFVECLTFHLHGNSLDRADCDSALDVQVLPAR